MTTTEKQLPARQPSALERQATAGIVEAIPSEALEASLAHYTRIKDVLDRAMPDCIMQIQGRAFRKKQYWRGVRMAFNLDVTCTGEQRIEVGPDWGYTVTYRAVAPNGSAAEGDGACMASEKKQGPQRTVHNVRSHAHTRAMNRAISNLVGFGEVSAEEAERDYDDSDDAPRDVRRDSRDTRQGARVVDTTATQQTAPKHHPSWATDHKRFFAKLGDLDLEYEAVAARVAADPHWGRRPSEMDQQDRDMLVTWLAAEYNRIAEENAARADAAYEQQREGSS